MKFSAHKIKWFYSLFFVCGKVMNQRGLVQQMEIELKEKMAASFNHLEKYVHTALFLCF